MSKEQTYQHYLDRIKAVDLTAAAPKPGTMEAKGAIQVRTRGLVWINHLH